MRLAAKIDFLSVDGLGAEMFSKFHQARTHRSPYFNISEHLVGISALQPAERVAAEAAAPFSAAAALPFVEAVAAPSEAAAQPIVAAVMEPFEALVLPFGSLVHSGRVAQFVAFLSHVEFVAQLVEF